MLAQKLAAKNWYPWLCLALSMLIVGINYVGQQILSPLLSQIGIEIAMSSTQAGLLASSYVFVGIFSPLIIASLYSKWGVRTVLIIGGVFLFCGFSLFILAKNYAMLLAGRFIAGFGTTAFMTGPLVILNHVFQGGRLGMAVGIYGIAPPLASFITLNVFVRLGSVIGWRWAIGVILVIIASVVCAVAMLLYLPGVGQTRKAEGKQGEGASMGCGIWLVATIAFAFGYCGLTYITFSPRFYVNQGYSQQLASFIPSLYMGLNLLFAPFVGMLFDRNLENKRRLAVLSLVMLGTLDLLMISPFPAKALCGVLMGVFTTAPPLAMFSLYGDVLPAERIAAGTCLISMVQNLGTSIGPVLAGAMLDGGVGFTGMFSSMAAIFLTSAFAMSRLKLGISKNISA